MPIAVGENVKIKGQTSIGQVMEINGKNATVAFGSIKTTVKLDRLERSNAAPKTEGIAKSTFVSSQTHDQMYEKKLNFKQDIDVRGMRGDEALQAITYFVDDAILVAWTRSYPSRNRNRNTPYTHPPIPVHRTRRQSLCRRACPVRRCRNYGSRF